MISTMPNARRIFSFTGKIKLIRNTSPVIIPVDAINDIIKTICDFSGSNRYAHGRLIPPASRVALIPIEPYRHKECSVISIPKHARTTQGISEVSNPSVASRI